MALQQQTVSIHLDPEAKKRLEKAATVVQQSPAGFIEQAVEERARDVLLEWAVQRYHEGDTTYSLLAEETGLTVPDIMYTMGYDGLDEILEALLVRAQTLAAEHENPDLLRLARKVTARVYEETRHPREWRDHS